MLKYILSFLYLINFKSEHISFSLCNCLSFLNKWLVNIHITAVLYVIAVKSLISVVLYFCNIMINTFGERSSFFPPTHAVKRGYRVEKTGIWPWMFISLFGLWQTKDTEFFCEKRGILSADCVSEALEFQSFKLLKFTSLVIFMLLNVFLQIWRWRSWRPKLQRSPGGP